MDKILSGKTVAIDIKGQIKSYTEELKASGKSLKISSILVGDDGGSVYYQNFQEKLANNLGIDFEKIKLDESISEDEDEKLSIFIETSYSSYEAIKSLIESSNDLIIEVNFAQNVTIKSKVSTETYLNLKNYLKDRQDTHIFAY